MTRSMVPPLAIMAFYFSVSSVIQRPDHCVVPLEDILLRVIAVSVHGHRVIINRGVFYLGFVIETMVVQQHVSLKSSKPPQVSLELLQGEQNQ